jgi:hypothetical protein
MTKAAVVEMLNVPAASPPVPQVSTKGPAPSSTSTARAWARIADAKPAISSTVSPRIRSAVTKAPIWAPVTCPPMIASIAAAASALVSVRPSTTAPMVARMSYCPSPATSLPYPYAAASVGRPWHPSSAPL